MTPIIFLDFDGVLNGYADPCDGRLRGLDPVRVARLNRIVKATGAHVVVTSAWRRIHRKRCQLADILNAVGFTGMVAGMTPCLPSADRGEEISKWVGCIPWRYRGSTFVILDDDAYDLGEMSDRLVRTDPILGLTEADADRCIEMLGGAR